MRVLFQFRNPIGCATRVSEFQHLYYLAEIPCHDDVKRGRPNETCRAKADFSVSGFMFPESSRYGAGAEYSQSVGHFGHNTLGFST